MEVDVGGDNGSDGGGEGGSEPSGLSPPEDDEEGGVDEPAEELPASPGEPSSRTTLFTSVSLLSEWWVLGQDCLGC